MNDKKNIVIISGSNKGLGKSFFNKLIEQQHVDLIVSISRHTSEEQNKLIREKDKRFLFISINLSELINHKPLKILENYCHSAEKVTFINNAGVIHPIEQIGCLDDRDIFHAIQVNISAPVIIINYLLSIFGNKQLCIVNISSGAANNPIDCWSTYSSAKAFMQMFINSLKHQEQGNPLIDAFNIDPGIIDTDMQKSVREANITSFTRHSEFMNYKNDGVLQDADIVASRILTQMNLII